MLVSIISIVIVGYDIVLKPKKTYTCLPREQDECENLSYYKSGTFCHLSLHTLYLMARFGMSQPPVR